MEIIFRHIARAVIVHENKIQVYVQKVGISAPRRLREPEEGGTEFRRNLNEYRTSKVNARFDVDYAS